MLDVRRLTLLREVSLRGSMTAAARELSYSHSAVSQQLALLEKEAGIPLLEKVGRNVRLTPAGEDLVRSTEAVLTALERAESDLAAFHERPQGVVRLVAFATISRTVVMAAMATLATDHPGLEVRLRVADPEVAVPLLVSRQVDIVLTDAFPGTEPSPATGIDQLLLGRDPVRGYLPSGVADDAAALPDVPWIMEPRASAATQWALRVCRERGFEPRIVHESSDLLLHLQMVERGLAAAFLPDLVVRESGGSTILPSPALPADQHRSIHLLIRHGAGSRPSTIAVRTALRQAFDEQMRH